MMNIQASQKAIVISSTRRFVSLLTEQHEIIQATSSAKALEVSVGDKVRYESRDSDNFIIEIEQRKNELVRSYRNEKKVMAANLDQIFAVTAVGQSFNCLFLDRLLAVASSENIPCTILVNKIDQGTSQSDSEIDLYRQLGLNVLCISAKFGIDLEPLTEMIENSEMETAALIGVSGVGKSTLLNRYVPDARSRTQEVNERTGLGRQTTTQALAHCYARKNGARFLFIDMPGLQSFGVGHLTVEQVAASFPEIQSRIGMCEFSDCGHIREKVCAIRQAVEHGEIARSRYASYIKMIEEIESEQEY